MSTDKKVLLSGVQPTGRPHIGNFFGAMKQFVELQDTHEGYVFVADLHALTTIQDAATMRKNIRDIVLDYLAIGLDPEKIVLFKQSDVSAPTELCWIFNCITTMPYLERAHAYKDALAKGKREDISVGTFEYPMLMAADILLYDASVVPVGADQKQHVEFARDTAEKFNRIFGETFRLPEPLIMENVATVPGIDGRKMSKSYDNTIPLFATDAQIDKLVMSIVTDSSASVPKNVYEMHKLFRTEAELAALYAAKAGKYKDLKEALATDLKAFIAPLRERRAAFEAQAGLVEKVLQNGAIKARARADAKMAQVRQAVGIAL